MTRSSPTIIVVHGGPGAPGSAHTLAADIETLMPGFTVLEPHQRSSADAGHAPLTVARHVADLHVLIHEHCGNDHPLLVGHSWGAMLILAFAAAHPDVPRSLTLIGSGTFDATSRARYQQLLAERKSDSADPFAAYHFDASPSLDKITFDETAHNQTWLDMLRCQSRGLYPQSFSKYPGPVTMIHGDHDPHPGSMIRDSLLPHLPQLTYHELPHCGHEPWRERHARDAFYLLLRDQLSKDATPDSPR